MEKRSSPLAYCELSIYYQVYTDGEVIDDDDVKLRLDEMIMLGYFVCRKMV